MKVLAKPAYEVAYQDLAALLKKHADNLSAIEMLAIAANMVGKLVALQDQRSVTPEMAMKTVSENIEVGNAEILQKLKQARAGGRA